MSGNALALIAGTVLAVGALAFVLYPLFFAVPQRAARRDPASGDADDSAVVALREIEFDRATGKLSDRDYAELRKIYGDRALHEMRAEKVEAGNPEPRDTIEAAVHAYRQSHRECPTCGLRPETDASYCSTCGGFLDRVCPACSAEITEAGAVFCSSCGVSLERSRANALV